MKFANIALLGSASANFLQDSILELDAATAAAPEDMMSHPAWKQYLITNKVGEMQCQPHEGYIFWDLKPIDANKDVDYIGKWAPEFNKHTFAVELCESSFIPSAKEMISYTLPSADGSTTSTMEFDALPQHLKRGNAYWTTPTEANPAEFNTEYSFLSGQFESVPTPDGDVDEYDGWTVTYASF